MAEYQNTVASSGEMAQRFIEFVLMQAQNAAFMLGQIPHPQTGQAEVNLDMGRILIDQLVMIQEKTKGNLNPDEARILGGTISNLQMLYVEAANREKGGRPQTTPETPPAAAPSEQAASPEISAGSEHGGDEKKKFVKSYGS
jgi:Domain of unknown function (DUF1844)